LARRIDSVRVEAHPTGRNKYDPTYGIKSIAIDRKGGKWVVPDCAATRTWARELMNYAPGSHAGDRGHGLVVGLRSGPGGGVAACLKKAVCV
jgi:hypothetical protein